MPDPGWILVGPPESLAPGVRKLVFLPDGQSAIVLNLGGQFFAMENSCPHAGASLAGGSCVEHIISCPAHGLRFDIRNGQCTASPSLRIRTYEVVMEDKQLWLRPPGLNC
ncbi:Rieske (2Fe-2S) protein (plasmid) [Cupriavidus necator]|uniref:Rieske (2Fe-2S) protein n=2 Tax=Cupriavidus necator TaxID=106590 RepID=A0A367P6P4_CUPNE|nr:Rieske (2Fe-2S) protein [Cupriavidus necator]QQX89512.1 Rieske (2Fe-2S) protein [Cupriavidus necator]RCJ03518.1 Rieske (2Fe-2S) protein [Cupriavidus necator]